MRDFFSGFEKAAEVGENSASPDWVRYAVPAAAAGVGAAALTYGLSRSGGKKLVSMVGHRNPQTVPTTMWGRFLDRIRFGADEVIPVTAKTLREKEPLRTLAKGEVGLVREPSMRRFLDKGEGQIVGSTAKATALMENKLKESKFVRSIAPDLHPKTKAYDVSGDGLERLERMKEIHDEWTKGGKGYFIKGVSTSQSGPGGASFLSDKDIQKVIDGTLPLNSEKGRFIQTNILSGKPIDTLMIQRRLNPVKDPITGKGIEFRVHSVGDKVIDATIRTGITPNPIEAAKAQAAMQKFVDNLPGEMKKQKAMFAADVMKTRDGYKIVETNPGGASGYLDPNFMREKGFIPHMKSVLLTNKLYGVLTGRKSPLVAATRSMATGAASGGLTVGGIYAYDKKDEIAERFKS